MKILNGLVLLVFGLILSGCVEEVDGNSRLLANQQGGSQRGGGSAFEVFQAALNSPVNQRTRLGSDGFLGPDSGISGAELFGVTDKGDISLNLVNVPIADAARAVLGEALGKNYTIKPGVQGNVSLQTTRPMSEKILLETFQTVLELNGATLQKSGGVIAIVPSSGASRRISQSRSGGGIGARVVAVPLQFVGTTEMVRLLDPIAGSSVGVQAIANRNILLISGTRDDINAAIDAVNLFDVDVLKGKSVGLFRLKAAEPDAVVEELKLIFETSEGGSLQNVVTFVPSQRLGAILVISSRSKYLGEAETWIKELDRTAGGTRRRPVVYNLQNRGAEDLAPILSEMIDQVAPSEGEQRSVGGSVRVIADNTKNAIIIWGNDTEQDSFARLIQSLDTTPTQVLLEATIAEVTLNDQLDLGLRWFFEKGNLRGGFSDVSNGSIASNFPGLSFIFQGASAGVTLNALSSVTNVNIVSSPSLMVLDNHEATLQIGDEVPIATQQVVDTANPNAPVVNTISFRNTGIILKVRPRVSSSGRVTLEIEQEVSSVAQTTTSGIDSPTISQRKITTTVVVNDGQTLALGGLIEESKGVTRTKVPIAGDIPIVGNLFKRKKDTQRKTELLILITPRVVRSGSEARQITDELRRRIPGANRNIQNGTGQSSTRHRLLD